MTATRAHDAPPCEHRGPEYLGMDQGHSHPGISDIEALVVGPIIVGVVPVVAVAVIFIAEKELEWRNHLAGAT